ncbi:cell division protein ZapA [Novosphingobium humi]|uniref:Cell division protein ZapA n=1 Tax=Novosphingobium humi TaxID=2282397 RepID=A0ABY7U1S2_9SPHN|nr:cell division protein ZapA [Novosphingobium humi]WCT78520.1 cell division protein ZapA [Novosphingobium humi]WJS97926.1 cell division protein ZapA [Novosphingobium humi]
MSRVDLMIGGRDYAVACSPGEEEHVRMLGRIIEEKMNALPGATNQSEMRSMLFAALLLADELHELRQQLDQGAPPADPATAARLEALAAGLEQLAASVEDLL